MFLQIVPYSVYPPRSGGSLRCFHLLEQLARHYHGRALIYQKESELSGLQEILPSGIEIHAPKSGPWDSVSSKSKLMAGLKYRWLTRSFQGPAQRFLLDVYSTLKRLTHEGAAIEVVLLEGTGALALVPMLRKWIPESILILDAHNVDHVLLKQELDAASRDGRPIGRSQHRYLAYVERLEKNLSRTVDAFFTCSDEDKRILTQLNHGLPGFRIPNGVDCSKMSFLAMDERQCRNELLFCGSLDYRPNVDGLNWFGSQIWPKIRRKIPEARLSVVGRGGADLSQFDTWANKDGIRWIGEVENVLEHYHAASLSICPLRVGSGTRLKILEAMSSGTPVVSTTIGAEGLLPSCSSAVVVADSPEEFSDAVCRVLSDPGLAGSRSQVGREIACSIFDWNVVGDQMIAAIKQLKRDKLTRLRGVS